MEGDVGRHSTVTILNSFRDNPMNTLAFLPSNGSFNLDMRDTSNSAPDMVITRPVVRPATAISSTLLTWIFTYDLDKHDVSGDEED